MSATPTSGQKGNARRLRGVVFDMDGVLVDSEPFTAEAAIKMFAEKGVQVRPQEFHPFVGQGEDRFIGGVAEARGVKLDMPRDKDRMYEIYLKLIEGRLKPLNGAVGFVAECRRRGLALAVASSADTIKVQGNLRALGLGDKAFDVVLCGSQVARKKPAPDIFLEACRRLELPPADCLVVEDAVAGVAAAKAAGARCLAVTSTFSREQLAQADWVAADLASVPPGVLDW
jgi:HAD superfamily hydrolase (TIGR01509 family)